MQRQVRRISYLCHSQVGSISSILSLDNRTKTPLWAKSAGRLPSRRIRSDRNKDKSAIFRLEHNIFISVESGSLYDLGVSLPSGTSSEASMHARAFKFISNLYPSIERTQGNLWTQSEPRRLAGTKADLTFGSQSSHAAESNFLSNALWVLIRRRNTDFRRPI